MKSLVLAIVLFMLSAVPAYAQAATVSAAPSPTPMVAGLYDENLDSTNSASVSATPAPTPEVRATTYLDPTNAPVSGTFETSLMILGLGISFILLGINFSKKSL
jgi:ABC-type transport system substrate-binding protein